MHYPCTQLLAVAFFVGIALVTPTRLSALPDFGTTLKDSVDSESQVSDPIAMQSDEPVRRNTSRSTQRIADPATEPASSTVVFGKGVWEAGHAGLALPGADNRIGEPLVIPGIEQFPENRILIFNNLGQKVFTQRGYANGWSGYDREGQPLPQGKYFVIVEVDGMGDDVQSYMNLVR